MSWIFFQTEQYQVQMFQNFHISQLVYTILLSEFELWYTHYTRFLLVFFTQPAKFPFDHLISPSRILAAWICASIWEHILIFSRSQRTNPVKYTRYSFEEMYVNIFVKTPDFNIYFIFETNANFQTKSKSQIIELINHDHSNKGAW